MNRTLLATLLTVALPTFAATACAADEAPASAAAAPGGYKGSLGKTDASAEAVFLDFAFDGELISAGCWGSQSQIQDQLLFTIGQLNGERSLGRLDQLAITDLETETVDGSCKTTYHARLPVAWGKKDAVPTTYDLLVPRNVSYSAQEAFATKYSHACVDWGAHDVDAGSMWYYFRPHRSGCTLAAEDIFTFTATVSASPIQTTGKYPEYHKVWEDGALKVVAVFGKYEDGATSGDAGIDAYNRFVTAMREELAVFTVTTVPAALPANPGVAVPDVALTATLPDGKSVEVVMLLVDNVRTAGATFDARYEALSGSADLIVYNGHAGLGANIRALATKGGWQTGQYAIVFMNGCDTYAYVDSALNEAHADVNPDDPEGTQHCDIVTNAMPSLFRSMAGATMAMVRGLMAFDEPRTYEQIFGGIDSAEVVLVSGEHDNVYVPGYGDATTPVEEPVAAWGGLDEAGTVAKDQETRYATPTLPAGRYRFTLTGTGDADLYVRLGEGPTLETYDCRPYRYGSDEVCDVTVGTAAPVHAMVVGWEATSDFTLVGERLAD